MGGPVAIIVLYKQKRGNIFVDVSSLLCYNDNNHETKINTSKGNIAKMLPLHFVSLQDLKL